MLMRPATLVLVFLSILSYSAPAHGATPAACDQYAKDAITQLKQAQSLGLPTPFPVWSDNYQHHYGWCLGQPENALSQGRAQRQAELDKAKGQVNQAPPPVAGTIPAIDVAPAQLPSQPNVYNVDKQDNGKACARYAAESVRQNQMNTSLGLGLTGPAWSNDFQSHNRWCLHGENIRTTPGQLENREKILQEFAIKNGNDAARRYAEEAVRQNEANKVMGTGYLPPVWSSDFNSHYQWSKAGNNLATTPGHLATRERMLQEAAVKGNITYAVADPASPAVAPSVKTGAKRVQLSPIKHLEQLSRISPAPDPIVAAFMHTLEKSLVSGVGGYSEIEQIMLRGINKLSPARQQLLMSKWQAIPAALRMSATPPSLRGLSATSRLETSAFSNALVETAKASGVVKIKQPINHGLTAPVNLSALLQAGATVVANAPTITGFTPQGPDGPWVRVGDTFTLYGKNFSSEPTKTKIHFLQKSGDKYEHVGTIFPQQASVTELQGTAITPGLSGYTNASTRIVVEVDGKFSAPYSVIVAPTLAPTPSIVSISPQSQYPGNMLLVDGVDLSGPLQMYVQAMNQQASAYRQQSYAFQVSPSLLNDTQFEFQIPQDTWSGHYKFNVRAGNSGYSNYATFEVKPPQFQMMFKKIHCIDESDPEWPNNDSIVTAWVVIVDNRIWTKGTGEYKSFEDNTWKDYSATDGMVVPAPGEKWESVQDFMLVQTSLYEIDSGDVKAWADGISSVSEIAGGVSTVLGTIFGNPEAGKIAGDIIKGIGSSLSKLINWIGGDNDFLGSQTVTWTAPELQKNTASSPSFSDKLPFMNDDDTGSYNVGFTIIRHQE